MVVFILHTFCTMCNWAPGSTDAQPSYRMVVCTVSALAQTDLALNSATDPITCVHTLLPNTNTPYSLSATAASCKTHQVVKVPASLPPPPAHYSKGFFEYRGAILCKAINYLMIQTSHRLSLHPNTQNVCFCLCSTLGLETMTWSCNFWNSLFLLLLPFFPIHGFQNCSFL